MNNAKCKMIPPFAKGGIGGIFLLILMLLLPVVGFSQNYAIPWYVFNNGGERMGSTAYRMDGTAWQTAIGNVASTNYQVFQGYWYGAEGLSGVNSPDEEKVLEGLANLPRVYALHQTQPNPAVSSNGVLFRYDLPRESRVDLRIYNLSGQLVRVIADGVEKAGYKSLRWDGKDYKGKAVSSGVYLYRLRANEFRSLRKMVVIR